MSCLEFLYSGAVLYYKPQVYCEQWKVCVCVCERQQLRESVCWFGRKSAWLDSTEPNDVHDPRAVHEAKLSMSLSD